MKGNFDDIETTVRKSAVIQERMSLVCAYMYKQFVEYQQSNVNTALLFDKIIDNMKIMVEYLKQSFNMRGIPSESIYFECDKQKHIATVYILWHAITFYFNMKSTPKALERAKDSPSLITGRIYAVKGIIPELNNGFSTEVEQKLLDSEIASLFVPFESTAKAIIKIRHLGNQEFLINQTDAPREFLLKVVEMVCAGGNYHSEGSKVTISI